MQETCRSSAIRTDGLITGDSWMRSLWCEAFLTDVIEQEARSRNILQEAHEPSRRRQ
jgi:hypothetical protein